MNQGKDHCMQTRETCLADDGDLGARLIEVNDAQEVVLVVALCRVSKRESVWSTKK